MHHCSAQSVSLGAAQDLLLYSAGILGQEAHPILGLHFCSARPVGLGGGLSWGSARPKLLCSGWLALGLGFWALGQVSPQLHEAWPLILNVQLGSYILLCHWCKSCTLVSCFFVRLGLFFWLCLAVGCHRDSVHLGLSCLRGCSVDWLVNLLCCGVVQLGWCTGGMYLVLVMLLVGYK